MVQLSGLPCNYCSMRHTGCHLDCKHYAAFHARMEAMRAERLRESTLTYTAAEPARKKAKRRGEG